MDKSYLTALSRRQFIRQAACAALGTGALSAAIRDLRLMNAAVAQSNIGPTDYKALVCIFMGGGNDSNNLIVPTITSEYNSYATIRTPVLALPLGGPNPLLGIVPMNSDGHAYGLHPVCQGINANSGLGLKPLFDAGRLAILFNTGTLSYPLTKAQYNASPSKRPPQLFSHADQVTQWQTSVPDAPPVNGWGGRTADLLNTVPLVQTNAPVSLSITLAGANTFEVGNAVSQYSVSTSGAISFQNLSGTRQTALTNILKQVYPNLQSQAYSDVAYHSINTGTVLNNAIATTANYTQNSVLRQYWDIPFPGNGTSPTPKLTNPVSTSVFSSSLGPQLNMIARLIEAGSRSVAQGGFGMLRQIFFCSVGGYDLHTGQTDVPVGGSVLNGAHSNLLYELSHCMAVFQAAIDQIGTAHGDPTFANRVTTFTASDFGRTFPCNGLGSDHGWGSHHLIMGGAVHGQQTYGKFPVLTVGGPDDTSTGRWIPTTACDQYFATLATWFGVDPGNLTTVFPNLGRFSTPNLGFMG